MEVLKPLEGRCSQRPQAWYKIIWLALAKKPRELQQIGPHFPICRSVSPNALNYSYPNSDRLGQQWAVVLLRTFVSSPPEHARQERTS